MIKSSVSICKSIGLGGLLAAVGSLNNNSDTPTRQAAGHSAKPLGKRIQAGYSLTIRTFSEMPLNLDV
jgi:hypothetical protein